MSEKINQHSTASRVELFSDGVFAIAITLLVLELVQILHVPSVYGLLETCKHHINSFIAYIIGFVTILICWINHHMAFKYIEKTDNRFLWVNGFLLFVVTLTPFPTAILAEYLEKEPQMAVAFFGVNYILISIAAFGICQYAYSHHLIRESSRSYYKAYKNIYLYAIIYTIAAFAICFVSSNIAIGMYVILFAFFAAPGKLTDRLHRTHSKSHS